MIMQNNTLPLFTKTMLSNYLALATRHSQSQILELLQCRYPPKINLNKILFARNLFFNCSTELEFCTEHCIDIDVFCEDFKTFRLLGNQLEHDDVMK